MVTFYLAAYDPSDSRSPDSDRPLFWSWADFEIPPNVLDTASNTIHRVTRENNGEPGPHIFAERDSDSDYVGIVSLQLGWCCYYRVAEGGKDAQHRPGRYVILCAFARQEHIVHVDPESVWYGDSFNDSALNAPQQLPLPQPAQTKIILSPSGRDSNPPKRLPRGFDNPIRSPEEITWKEFCEACSRLPNDQEWSVFVRIKGGAKFGRITCSPRTSTIFRPEKSSPPGSPSRPRNMSGVLPSPRLTMPIGTIVLGVASILLCSIVVYQGMMTTPGISLSEPLPHSSPAGMQPTATENMSAPTPQDSPWTVSTQVVVLVIFSSSLSFLLRLILGNVTREHFRLEILTRDRDAPRV